VLNEEEFGRAKARLLAGETSPSAPVAELNRLRRSVGDHWLGGVCGGIAQITGLESWIWRLLFVVVALFGGAGVFIYLLLWLLVPAES
jgi:phage shock protein PspC (stress-responsive transcriptional regulator)